MAWIATNHLEYTPPCTKHDWMTTTEYDRSARTSSFDKFKGKVSHWTLTCSTTSCFYSTPLNFDARAGYLDLIHGPVCRELHPWTYFCHSSRCPPAKQWAYFYPSFCVSVSLLHTSYRSFHVHRCFSLRVFHRHTVCRLCNTRSTSKRTFAYFRCTVCWLFWWANSSTCELIGKLRMSGYLLVSYSPYSIRQSTVGIFLVLLGTYITFSMSLMLSEWNFSISWKWFRFSFVCKWYTILVRRIGSYFVYSWLLGLFPSCCGTYTSRWMCEWFSLAFSQQCEFGNRFTIQWWMTRAMAMVCTIVLCRRVK